MSLIAEPLELEPDVIRLARSLADREALCVLWDPAGRRPSYIACDPSDAVSAWDPEPELGLASVRRAERGVPRWIGMLPYEAMRHLERPSYITRPDPRLSPLITQPRWQRYPAVLEVSDRVRAIGDEPKAVRAIARAVQRPAVTKQAELKLLEPVEDPRRHEERIRRALVLIARGELYQVNLARRFELRLEGDALELLCKLGQRTQALWSTLLSFGTVRIVSSSPERFLSVLPGGRVLTEPIKGTRPRGNTPESDAALRSELDADEKERAELTMIIDIERNDLGKLCLPGTVQLEVTPHVHSYPTLHHRLATVAGQLRPGVDRSQLLEAMLPSGSVTGAPKVRAMEVIAQLEAQRRGLYTGAFGWLDHDGGLELGMAIRTVEVDALRGGGTYWVGGGIVADSDPRREVDETLWKARHLTD